MRKYIILIITVFALLVVNGALAAGQFVPYYSGAETFEGYFISQGENTPLILLVHDWDGLTDYEVKRADMLAALGYSVFAVDLFGKGMRPKETEEKRKLTGRLYADRQRMRALLNAGLKKARELGGNVGNSIAVGYCFGGAAVLELARSGADLKGFVTFHGGLATPENQNYTQVKGTVLVFHGSADTSVTIDQFADLARELEKEKIPHEMVTYSGAPHAFTVFGTSRYREDADKKSWQRFTRFLTEIF